MIILSQSCLFLTKSSIVDTRTTLDHKFLVTVQSGSGLTLSCVFFSVCSCAEFQEMLCFHKMCCHSGTSTHTYLGKKSTNFYQFILIQAKGLIIFLQVLGKREKSQSRTQAIYLFFFHLMNLVGFVL